MVVKITTCQTYGYDELPTLLALENSPLNLITSSPRPANAPPAFPHTQLRKSLRLLIDAEDIPNLAGGEDDELDISYVYSGWAPMSIRLVQCITQKSLVLTKPNNHGGKRQQRSVSSAAGDQVSQSQETSSTIKAPAQRITGWKGFEEVVELIPGDSFDIHLSEGSKESRLLESKITEGKHSVSCASARS